jgi:AbiV family abortive infection protein
VTANPQLKPLPSPVEARDGGYLAAENAQALLNAATAAAAARSWGAAVGIAVLALEEAAKARALFGCFGASRIPGMKFGFSDKQFRAMIYGPHGFRHAAAFWQSISSQTRSAILTGAWPGDATGGEKVKADVFAGEWLVTADQLKQKGFYVDYRDDGFWASPSALVQGDWLEAQSVAAPFVAEAVAQAEKARGWSEP